MSTPNQKNPGNIKTENPNLTKTQAKALFFQFIPWKHTLMLFFNFSFQKVHRNKIEC
jgi:hypothetical protein